MNTVLNLDTHKTMAATGVSLSMRPANYKAKVRTIVGGGLSRDERAWVERHFDDGLTPERSAEILLQLRRCDRNRRAMAEAMEMYDRYGIEI